MKEIKLPNHKAKFLQMKFDQNNKLWINTYQNGIITYNIENEHLDDDPFPEIGLDKKRTWWLN